MFYQAETLSKNPILVHCFMLSSSSGRMLSKKDDTAENLIKRVNFQNEIDDHKTAEDRRFGQKNFFETESVEIKPDEIMPVRIDSVKNQITETKPSKIKSIETKSTEAKTNEAESSKTKSSETKSSETKSSEIQPFETVDAELNTTENESPKKLTNLKNPKNWKNWIDIESDSETKAK